MFCWSFKNLNRRSTTVKKMEEKRENFLHICRAVYIQPPNNCCCCCCCMVIGVWLVVGRNTGGGKKMKKKDSDDQMQLL